MKVSYQGKVKNLSKVGQNMAELRKLINRKFKESSLDDAADHGDLTQSMSMSTL
jgi:hypothetical protein